MITTTQAATNNMTGGVSSTLVTYAAYPSFSSGGIAECCLCSCECDYIEKAFVNTIATTGDRSTFLYPRVRPDDTITISVVKDGEVIPMTALLGTLYSTSNLEGAIVDWIRIKNAHGYGYYKVQAVISDGVNSVTLTSHKYHVLEYDFCLTNYTVKIESYISGSINDYLDLGTLEIYQSTRVSGWMERVKPELEQTSYQDSSRTHKQIQDKLIEGYTLHTHSIPSDVANYINRSHLLANRIFLTDFNQNAIESFYELPVRVVGIPNYEELRLVKKAEYTYEFKDRKDKYIKV